MARRAVLYARVSGDDRSKDGRNLASQRQMCRDYALEHGYQIIAELAEDDRGAKGSSLDLEKLNQALDMARNGEFDVLVVREIDRFARKLAKQLIVETDLKRAGVVIDYVLGEYPDTPEGNLNKNIKAVIAEYEAMKTAERTTRARFGFVRDGNVPCHGKPPYGYRLTEHNGKRALAIHEDEAETVRWIFEWYVFGKDGEPRISIHGLAQELTKLRIPTAADKGNGHRTAERGHWAPSSVGNILSNETYAGTWHYGKDHFVDGKKVKNEQEHLVPVSVPAIVSEEMFDAAQRQREKSKRLAKRQRKYDYLLSGHVRCGECGRGMSGQTFRKGKKTYRYYWCHLKTAYSPIECTNSTHFRVGQVDTAVWDWIKSWLLNPEQLARGLRKHQEQRENENAPLRKRLQVIDDLLVDGKSQLERLLDLYLSGDFPKEVLTERKARLEETIKGLESERGNLERLLGEQSLTQRQIATIEQFVSKVATGLEQADQSFEAQTKLVEILDVQVRLSVEDGEKVVHVSCKLKSQRSLLYIVPKSP